MSVSTILGTVALIFDCLTMILLAYTFYAIRKADRITRDITNRVNRERWNLIAEADKVTREETQ